MNNKILYLLPANVRTLNVHILCRQVNVSVGCIQDSVIAFFDVKSGLEHLIKVWVGLTVQAAVDSEVLWCVPFCISPLL